VDRRSGHAHILAASFPHAGDRVPRLRNAAKLPFLSRSRFLSPITTFFRSDHRLCLDLCSITTRSPSRSVTVRSPSRLRVRPASCILERSWSALSERLLSPAAATRLASARTSTTAAALNILRREPDRCRYCFYSEPLLLLELLELLLPLACDAPRLHTAHSRQPRARQQQLSSSAAAAVRVEAVTATVKLTRRMLRDRSGVEVRAEVVRVAARETAVVPKVADMIVRVI